MSRKIFSAALALTVAGGVYFGGQPAHASNMGFKLERSFDLTRDPSGRPYLNLYLLSYPVFNGLGDVANDGPGSPANKCVGDPTGPATGDGRINSADSLCDHWTSRQGAMTMFRFDRNACAYQFRTATQTAFGVQFSGSYTADLERDIGYEIQVSASTPISPQNRAVIVGSHDPSYTGRPIISAACPQRASLRLDFQMLPYHTMYTNSDEILCGLEGVDWVDVAAPIGTPDTCPNGTQAGNEGIPFDNTHALQVQWYDNEVAHGYVARTVVRGPFGLQFTGSRFPLRPGDAYIFKIDPDHLPTTFLTPHF